MGGGAHLAGCAGKYMFLGASQDYEKVPGRKESRKRGYWGRKIMEPLVWTTKKEKRRETKISPVGEKREIAWKDCALGVVGRRRKKALNWGLSNGSIRIGGEGKEVKVMAGKRFTRIHVTRISITS